MRLVLVLVVLAACGTTDTDSPAQLQDPATCKQCHPTHFTQWQGSMHAYASIDPVFVAMNKRGQRETNNALGTFCVQCHAPMAVALGKTDGTDYDPASLTPATNGITCYFCHDVSKIVDTHNNGLQVALDSNMRGGLQNPVASPAHTSTYDPLMDGDTNESEMCGSCHDIVTPAPNNVALERTFQEWKTTFFSLDDPKHHLSCTGCHMRSTTDRVADPSLGTPSRPNGFHLHQWPGIDQSVTDGFPGMADQAAAIQGDLDPAVGIIGATPITGPPAPGGICVDPVDGISVRMDSIGVGHAWPSGASQDRRAWLELVAKDANGVVLFQTGVVPDGMDPEDIGDASLVELGDHMLDGSGNPVHFFWQAASIATTCNPSLSGGPVPNNHVCLLVQPTTLDPNNGAFDHSSRAVFQIGDTSKIAHIDAQIHIRPYDLATIKDLISSGDLDASILAKLPTLDIKGTQRTWDVSTAGTGPAINTNCSPH